ncbi:unnamed protein product [Rangifer tarandus platyrhynchus]|uniref:Uncharacterized protein n=2 Tax=Rangifer tarandus platyrhynchus TaxID=3082113 RepID=A0ABN8ZBA9_RANTA|nr:unnamed protein product [Rangifer tarandus platyrhynchus]
MPIPSHYSCGEAWERGEWGRALPALGLPGVRCQILQVFRKRGHPQVAQSHDSWRGGILGLMDTAASSILCKRTSADWRKGYSGSFELERSPGDYRAPGIRTPSAFLKRYLCLAPIVNSLNITLTQIRRIHTTTHLPFVSLAEKHRFFV